MELQSRLISFILQYLDSVSFLIIAGLSIAIIYGMMGIINMATGEFMMVGAYIFALLVHAGCSWLIALLASFIGGAILGLLLDKIIICRMHGKPIESLVITYGVSLIISQIVFIIFGPSIGGVAAPIGSISIFGMQYSGYRLFIVGVAFFLMLCIYYLFQHTRIGIHVRATMQNREIAGCMGVNIDRMNTMPFVLASGLAGLGGALYAPIMTLSPTYGNNFLTHGFVAVIVGGTEPLIGTVLSSLALATVESSLANLMNTLFGRIGILVVAILLLRFLPKGFSGLLENRMLRQRSGTEKTSKEGENT